MAFSYLPVSQGTRRGIILFRQHKVDEVLICHAIWKSTPLGIGKHSITDLVDAVDDALRQGVFPVLQQVSLHDLGILIAIKLEELAVEHVEVLRGEVVEHFVDVSLLIDVHTCGEQIRPADFGQRELPRKRSIHLRVVAKYKS